MKVVWSLYVNLGIQLFTVKTLGWEQKKMASNIDFYYNIL